jgi:hypothetical protein
MKKADLRMKEKTMINNGQSKKYPLMRFFTRGLLLAFSAMVFTASSLFASQEMKPKNVLVLASYNPTSPVGFMWNRGIRSVLGAEASFPVHIDIEYREFEKKILSSLWGSSTVMKP